MHSGRVQKIPVWGFDDECVVLITGQLEEPLAQDIHVTKLAEKTIERLALDDRDSGSIKHEGVVTCPQRSTI